MQRQSFASDEERFWSKIDRTGECWVWTPPRTATGYGRFMLAQPKRGVLAHRYAWQLANGPVPNGMELDHTCRNRACVNPAHLEPVDHATNVRRGENATKTHCKRGHPLSGHNLLPNNRGVRVCRACALPHRRAVDRRRAARRHAS